MIALDPPPSNKDTQQSVKGLFAVNQQKMTETVPAVSYTPLIVFPSMSMTLFTAFERKQVHCSPSQEALPQSTGRPRM